ncbi:MAG: DUF2065 domain-containing protein [Deltaproteobacteria bacterium]|nr:DUF2065 domain-containing protein [Deltaproteobacteria bacterium]
METYGLKFFLSVLALVFVIEGMPYFLAPSGIKKWLEIIREMPDSAIRGIGFLFMLTGLGVLYIALRVI